MVHYIGISDIERLVGDIGIGPFLSRLADTIETDYRRWDEFEKSARVASHSHDGVIELMPASDGTLYGFKYVNGHPRNTAQGLLTVMAFGMLAEVSTGCPLLLSELTVTTALRTAATSAMAARWLARPESRRMALIGNGAQSEFQAIAFHELVGVRELRLFDIDPAASAKVAQNLARVPALHNLQVHMCSSVREAVRGADIVTTVTADKRRAVILDETLVEPGMHLNAVGGDCPGKTELSRELLLRPDVRIVVEFEPQTRIEGELQQVPADHPVTALADVIRQRAQGRRSAQDITLFDSVGFALEDFSALRLLHEILNEQTGPVRELDLVPTLDDPKDLFGGTLGRSSRTRLRRVA
jgi:ornithine cyclodeaminase